ncbi:uncharacterized protein LOC141685938 [Apium graveolens]|uniref:uncharacterized protein LOC141685938 n=1 Tax=Apium graveolens TaxID=4045 RepID=UPI003D7A8117
MNSKSNSWDTNLVRDIFVERDVNLILSIPLNNAVADTCTYNCFKQWFANTVQSLEKKAIEEMVMVCWAIWKNMNAIVWKQYGSEFSEVCKSAKLYLNQWKTAQDKSFSNSLGFMTQEDGLEQWVRPRDGMIKINVDAAIFEDTSKYCYSMIARDGAGELVAATTKCRSGTIVSEMAEAIGIKEALSWIKNEVTQPAIVESDCLSVIQAIRCSTVNLSYLGRIIDECKALLSDLKNRHVVLNFVKRSANNVTHFLARHNSSIADRQWYGGNVFPELYQVICNDLKF